MLNLQSAHIVYRPTYHTPVGHTSTTGLCTILQSAKHRLLAYVPYSSRPHIDFRTTTSPVSHTSTTGLCTILQSATHRLQAYVSYSSRPHIDYRPMHHTPVGHTSTTGLRPNSSWPHINYRPTHDTVQWRSHIDYRLTYHSPVGHTSTTGLRTILQSVTHRLPAYVPYSSRPHIECRPRKEGRKEGNVWLYVHRDH